MKTIHLKNIHITFEDDQPAQVQLQYVERVTVEGEVLRETYLPHDAFAIAQATKSEKAALKAALGQLTADQATQLADLRAEVEPLREQAAALATEAASLREQVGELTGEVAPLREEAAMLRERVQELEMPVFTEGTA